MCSNGLEGSSFHTRAFEKIALAMFTRFATVARASVRVEPSERVRASVVIAARQASASAAPIWSIGLPVPKCWSRGLRGRRTTLA
jgi:hypothetical protein